MPSSKNNGGPYKKKDLISTSLKHHQKVLAKRSNKLDKRQRKMVNDEALRQKQLDYDTDSSAEEDASVSENEQLDHVAGKYYSDASKKRKAPPADLNDGEKLKPIYRGAWSDDESDSSDYEDVPTAKKSSSKKPSGASKSDSSSDNSASESESSGSSSGSDSGSDSSSDGESDSEDESRAKWKGRDLHATSRRGRVANAGDDATFEEKAQEAQEAKLIQKRRAERLKRAVESTMNEDYASESEEDSDDEDDQTNDEMEQALVSDLKEKLSIVQNQIQPLLRKVKEEGYATDEGLSYLETKYQLLISYCMNIVFFLTLRASGKSVEDHPVIEYLVEQRKMLEKIKPIDDRMKYQLDKLISIANSSEIIQEKPSAAANADAMSDEEESSSDEEDTADARSKPNLRDFMEADDASTTTDEDESSSEDERVTRAATRVKKPAAPAQETYVAPKLMAVASNMDKREKKLSQYEKKKEKLKKKLADSGMLQDIMEDFGDAPIVEESGIKKSNSEAVRFAEELEEYELRNMKRLQLNKKQKKLLRQAEQDVGNFDDELSNLEAFSEYVSHEAKGKDIEDEKITLLNYLDNEEEARQFLNEQDKKNGEEKNSRKRKRIQEPEFDSSAGSESDIIEDMGPRSKKLRRLAEDRKLGHRGDEPERRAASKHILKNHGLRANKRRDLQNSRVKFKKRFDNKTAKQRSMVKQMEKLRGGSGMLPRVDANTVRSRKAK